MKYRIKIEKIDHNHNVIVAEQTELIEEMAKSTSIDALRLVTEQTIRRFEQTEAHYLKNLSKIDNIQLTPIEWLVKRVELIANNRSLSREEYVKLYNEAIKQAKEMEKEQTIKTSLFWSHSTVKRKDIEDYYNETYGGNK